MLRASFPRALGTPLVCVFTGAGCSCRRDAKVEGIGSTMVVRPSMKDSISLQTPGYCCGGREVLRASIPPALVTPLERAFPGAGCSFRRDHSCLRRRHQASHQSA